MIASLTVCACSEKDEWQSPHPQSNEERWIAHGGGTIHGMPCTNSLEALNASYLLGMHLIEIDFQWTKDDYLVLLHDWKKTMRNRYNDTPGQRTLAQFKELKISSPTAPHITLMTAQELFVWLDAHPNVVIITDIKSNVLKALSWIQKHYPFYAERFIPQVYHFEEYEPVRRLGYYRVILTLYRIHKKPDQEIVNFCKTHSVWAVTMPEDRVQKSQFIQDLGRLNIPVYAHTINESEKVKALFRSGVFGVYTDRTDLYEINKRSMGQNQSMS